MRNIILLITVTFLMNNLFSQEVIPYNTFDPEQMQEGIYLKDTQNLRDHFIGTWKWQSGNSSFTIELHKIDMEFLSLMGIYWDIVIGKYTYIENGDVVVDAGDYDLSNQDNWIIFGSCPESASEFNMRFRDIPKAKSVQMDVEKINSTQITISFKNDEGLKVTSSENSNPPSSGITITQGNYYWDFTIPDGITLTKQ